PFSAGPLSVFCRCKMANCRRHRRDSPASGEKRQARFMRERKQERKLPPKGSTAARGDSVMAAQGVRWQLAEGALVAFRKAAEVYEAIIHGDLGDVADLGGRVAQAAMDLLEFPLPDVGFRRGADLALEQHVQRTRAHVRQLGQLLDGDVLLQVLV